MESTRRKGTALLTTLGVLVALVVVAIAAGTSIPRGEGQASGPGHALGDVLFSLYLLTLVFAAVFFVYLLLLRRQLEAQGADVKRRRPLQTLLSLVVLIGIGSLMAQRLGGLERLAPLEEEIPAFGTGTFAQTTGPNAVVTEPTFAWGPVLATVGLVALAVGAWWYAGRTRRRARGELSRDDTLATDLAAAMNESLDDLRAEPDPRRAVIAAYARLERVLAAHALPRRPAEAPLEYLARMLDDLSVSPRAARRLTDLFERAKFSQHAVGTEMKEEAIVALETVRDDLLAARALAEQEREAMIAAQRERATT